MTRDHRVARAPSPSSSRARLLAFGVCAAVAAAGGKEALSQSAPPEGAGGQPRTAVAQPETSEKPSAPSPPPSIQSSLGPAGDPGGIRALFSSKGIEYSLTYIGETLGNPTGGARRGVIHEGRLDVQFDADLDKLLGWKGAALHANFYQIHGEGLSRYHLNNLLVASGIEALPSTRLYELWLEQKLLDDKLAVRVGQLAADTEFFVSQTATLFVNATFGWPAITAADLPSGGPAYPLATPAVRVKVTPSERFSLLVGVFNGDPAGPAGPLDPPDPERRNRRGTDFRVTDPALAIAEAAWSYKLAAGDLPGTVKAGGWHHFGRFDDLRFGADGLSLADPLSSGLARRFRGNDGVYGIIDQSLYRVPGTTDQGVSAFARVSGSPGDRNLISFYADAGLAFKGLVPTRPDDTLGVSAAYAKIADSARRSDVDAILFSGVPAPVRLGEALVEVTYQAQIVPGWTVQPDFQYVFRPGGNIANPRDALGRRIRNAAVFGLRTTVRY